MHPGRAATVIHNSGHYQHIDWDHISQMSMWTIDDLNEHSLRARAALTVYQRGYVYYLQKRVTLIELGEGFAHLHVQGSQQYCVDIWQDFRGIGFNCTCPYARDGRFCKHNVAAGLYLYNYLREHGPDMWKATLNRALQTAQRTPAARQSRTPYLLFFSLQKSYEIWAIQPVTLPTRALPEMLEQKVGPAAFAGIEEILEHNPWMTSKVKYPRSKLNPAACVNCSPEVVAMANLILQSQGYTTPSYYYYYAATSSVQDFFPLLASTGAPLFYGDNDQPLQKSLQILPGEALLEIEMSRKNGSGMVLQARLRVGEKSIPLERDKATVITKNPVWIMADSYLIRLADRFASDLVNVFFDTPQVEIPAESETEFLENYFLPLAAHLDMQGEDIAWEELHAEPVKRLYLEEEGKTLLVKLRFGYAEYEVPYQKHPPEISIQRKADDSWTLVRVHRDRQAEEQIYRSISSARYGLKYGAHIYGPEVFVLRARVDPIDFLLRKVPKLIEDGFEIYGEEELKSARVNRNRPTLSLNVSSGIDWFDVKAVVKFGEVDVSLQEIRRALRKKNRFVKLADGTIGEIPEAWVEKYRHLFGLGEQTEEGVRFSEHHLTLIDQLLGEADRFAADSEYRKRLQKLKEFSGIRERPLPQGFTGTLRPYQKAGYDWLHFLHEYRFGGCLADDMGLGKTVQVLVFLQSLRENNHAKTADLIVVPRSLLVNWEREAARFTPDLKVYRHFGPARKKDTAVFDQYDLILTTYGTMRRDIQMLRDYRFHYAVLDESQAIKNPVAQTSKAARLLNSDHRLVMTGTPVENNTYELWSQFAFLNPGLLGNLEYFKKEFAAPIERKGDQDTANFLRKMVYPFILRRTKDQVAPELPPRTERILLSDMEPAQRKFYNRTRDYYRGIVLGMLEEEGLNNARMKILEGLLRLRQISNHPKLVDSKFRGQSAKLEMLIEHLETLHSEGHKALVFSQFVQMLQLVRAELDRRKIPYVYLDGRTRKRQQRVDQFQNDPGIPFFLISLKAGGVGLNLTAADYVIHIDPWWNPAVEMQATDRTHRIGQDKPVFVYKLITRDSVEEKILKLQERKKKLVEQLISTEASFFKHITPEDVKVLFS